MKTGESMKKVNLILVILMGIFLINSKSFFLQAGGSFNNLLQGDEYLAFASKMPEVKGGMDEITKKIVYPEEAVSKGIQGKVFLIAFVDEDGTVSDVRILRGLGSGCDEAAIQAVKSCSFTPGEHDGKKVKVKMSLAIPFKL